MTNDFLRRWDSDTLMFAERELLRKLPTIYKRKYPQLKLASGVILPVKQQPELAWEDEVEIEEYDSVGINALISDYPKGGTRVGTLSRRIRYKIKTHSSNCAWSWEEVNKARVHNRPLAAMQLAATREAYEKFVDKTGFDGDEGAGLPGIFDIPMRRFSSSVQINSSFTPDQIVGMLNDHVSRLVSDTNELAVPKKLVLPIDKRNYLFNPRPYGDKTIGQMFLDNQRELGYIEEIVASNQMKGRGYNGTDVMLILPNDPERLYVSIPMAYTIISSENVGLEYITHTGGRFGGVHCHKPMELAMVENI